MTCDLKNWRRRGFYAETSLVKHLRGKKYEAVRIPCSNPSLSSLPDVLGRKDMHVFAFEVKKGKYYTYYEPHQIKKLYDFLDKFIPLPRQYLHPILAAKFGKRWVFKELSWPDRDRFKENLVIKRRDHSDELLH
jgi:Holliday junction resolvase